MDAIDNASGRGTQIVFADLNLRPTENRGAASQSADRDRRAMHRADGLLIEYRARLKRRAVAAVHYCSVRGPSRPADSIERGGHTNGRCL